MLIRSMWRSSVRSFARPHQERGSALLVALALLALAAALLAGSAQAGRGLTRAAQSYRSSLTAEAEARVALAEFAASWSSAHDSLNIGGSAETTWGPRGVGSAGLVAVHRFRVIRISAVRYILGVESSVGPPGQSAARRRLSLIIDWRPVSDTLATRRILAPIPRWSLSDLY